MLLESLGQTKLLRTLGYAYIFTSNYCLSLFFQELLQRPSEMEIKQTNGYATPNNTKELCKKQVEERTANSGKELLFVKEHIRNRTLQVPCYL